MLVLGGIVLLLGCYLIYALVHPEKFRFAVSETEINRRSLSCYSLH